MLAFFIIKNQNTNFFLFIFFFVYLSSWIIYLKTLENIKKTKTQRLWCLLWALIISIGAFNASAVTIKAKATTTKWTEPCVWYWGGGSQQNTANPMQFVSEDGTYSWWTFELPDAATGFLFKNISNGSDWTLQ